MKRHVTPPLVHWIKRLRMPWAVITAVLYFAAIPITIIAFPNTGTLGLAVLILFSGFTGAMTTLADLLVSADEAKQTEELNSKVD